MTILNEEDKEDSKYNESLKSRVADDIVLYISSEYGLANDEIKVNYYVGHTEYVAIIIKKRGFEWNTEEVLDMTSVPLNMVESKGHTLHVAPDGVRD